jgi:hypothetical protein
MATYESGILGAFNGKVGTVVGANWRGKDIMRSRPRKSRKPATVLQKMQREKFAMVASFIRSVDSTIWRFFGNDNSLLTQRNQASKHILKNAVLHNGEEASLDYSKIVLTKGSLLNLNALSIGTQAEQTIQVNWTDNSMQSGEASAEDVIMAVVHNPATGQSWFAESLATRSTGQMSIQMPHQWTGNTVHVWIAVASESGMKYATSQYLGTVVLS